MFWKRLFKKKQKSSTSSNSGPGTCPNCNSKPVAFNPVTGQYFAHCSKLCARQATGGGPGQNGSPVLSLCENCKRRPKFKDGTKVHPYCGRTCANLAASRGSTLASLLNPRVSRSTYSTRFSTTFPGTMCRTPGCISPVFIDANGVVSNYCKGTHKQWGEHGCISCRAAPKSGHLVMCRSCHNRALSMAPVIIEIPEDHENHKSVVTQFQQSWRHNTTCPKVRAVYKIINTAENLRGYKKYLDSVEARGKFVSMGKSPGNENRRWHGTRRKCNIGDRGVTTLCTNPRCSLCSVIESSFDVGFYRGATGWGRFGAGIYTSSTSSKSNDYSINDGIISDWKALLLNRVVVGNGVKLTHDDTTLTQPPPGYDSVLAEAVPGGNLNYDELVVYNNDAVRPSYLVMYESP